MHKITLSLLAGGFLAVPAASQAAEPVVLSEAQLDSIRAGSILVVQSNGGNAAFAVANGSGDAFAGASTPDGARADALGEEALAGTVTNVETVGLDTVE